MGICLLCSGDRKEVVGVRLVIEGDCAGLRGRVRTRILFWVRFG